MSGVEMAFDDNLARAATLPSRFYTDPQVLADEYARIFARTWQLVGRADQVARPGDYFTVTVAEEPLIVVRGADDRLRVISNVCRHRAGEVARGAGNRRVFQCGYHGWTFGLDGRLLGTPEFEGVECFTKEENCLPEFRVEEWAGLLFVNLDPQAPPLGEVLEDLPARIMHRDLSEFKPAARKDWYVDCNWKVYIDNYLEGYHIPVAHPSLNRELDYANYRVETRRYYSIQHAPIRRRADSRINPGDGEEAQYFWVFPNLMLNIYPDNYSTNLILPVGHDRTVTIFEWFYREPQSAASQAALSRTMAFSDEIQLEDIAVCEAVQRGLRSRTYDRGRYSVKRENGLHHFHRLFAEFMARP